MKKHSIIVSTSTPDTSFQASVVLAENARSESMKWVVSESIRLGEKDEEMIDLLVDRFGQKMVSDLFNGVVQSTIRVVKRRANMS